MISRLSDRWIFWTMNATHACIGLLFPIFFALASFFFSLP
jgi:hypothetical protein